MFWFVTPTGRDNIPNTVRHPLILVWVRWVGWPCTTANIPNNLVTVVTVVRQYPREDLIVTGGLYQVVV